MTARDNILLCLEQYAAAEALAANDGSGLSMGTEYCIANLLAEIDWSKMAPAKVRAIFQLLLARCDVRTVARMSGVAIAIETSIATACD